MKKTQFDIVVFGATSFVGQILCRYLLAQYGADKKLRWAIAGRSQQKLERLRAELGDPAKTLPIIIADAADETALTAMCEQTKVVVSTVGPYALYGEPLVKVCATLGTDYCDLTGEAPWMRRMISSYAARAEESGARIVQCCGFDSIPSDYGVWFLQQQAMKQYGEPCSTISMRVKAMKGAASGGTVASILNIVKEATKDSALRTELTNPYTLCPDGYINSTRQFNLKTILFDEPNQSWAAPFIMAMINTRVVFRSNALMNDAYGTAFKYDEAMLTGKGLAGRTAAIAFVAGLMGFVTASAVAPSRWVLEKFLPAPGEGPSQAAQENGFFDLRFFGKTDDGQTVNVKVTGDRDPGYGSTGKMLGEAAVCLALDPEMTSKAGGFWTPTTAFGETLLKRLIENAGLKFESI